MRRWTPTLLILIVLCGCASMAVAQARRSKDGPATSQSKTAKVSQSAKQNSAQSKQKRSKKPATPKSRSAVVITPKTEAVALGFARQHHQELADLLRQMKLHKRSILQYRRAVRQISAARDKLERIKQRSPDRYRLELERWKLDSRIRLLAARMTMSKDASFEDELKDLLLERTNIRLQQLKQERERLQKYLGRAETRLLRIEKDIELSETDPEAAAQKDFKQIIKSLRTYTPKTKKSARNKKGNKNTNQSQSNTKASTRKPSSRK